MADRDIAYRINLLFSKGGVDEASAALDGLKTKLMNLDPGSATDSGPFGSLKGVKSGDPTDTMSKTYAELDAKLKTVTADASKLNDEWLNSVSNVQFLGKTADEQLNLAVQQLAHASDAGGDFDQTLANLATRIGTLASQSSIDLGQLGQDLGLDAAQAQKLVEATAAAQGASQFRASFRQTRPLGGLATGLNSLGTVANRFGASPELVSGLQGAAGFGTLAEEIPRIEAAFKALPATLKAVYTQIGGASGTGLIGALGLLAIALTIAQAATKKSYDSTAAQLDEQAKYFTIIQTGTTESINKAKAEAQAKLDASTQNEALLRSQQAAVHAAVDQFGRDVGLPNLLKAGIALGVTGGEVKALDDKVDAAGVTTAAAAKEVDILNDALGSDQVAANNAAEAVKKHAQAITDSANQGLSDRASILALQGKSSDDLKKQREDLIEQNASLATARGALGVGPFFGGDDDPRQKAFDDFNKQITANNVIIDAITNSYLANAQATEQAKKNQDGYVDGLNQTADVQRALASLIRDSDPKSAGARFDAISDELKVLQEEQGKLLGLPELTGKALDQFTSNFNTITSLEAESANILAHSASIISKATVQLNGDLDDIYQKLVLGNQKANTQREQDDEKARRTAHDSDTDAYEKEQKDLGALQKKAAADEADALTKHLAKLKKIQEDASDALSKAIRGRDAGAAEKALEDARQKAKDENDAFTQQKKDAQKTLDDQTQAIKDAYTAQLSDIQRRLQEQLDDHKQTYLDQVKANQAAAAQETSDKKKAYADQIRDLNNALAAQKYASGANAADLLAQVYDFGAKAGTAIHDFVTNSLANLANLVNAGVSPSIASISGQSGNSIATSVSTIINAQTNANPNQIAAIASKQAVAAVKTAAKRAVTGGV